MLNFTTLRALQSTRITSRITTSRITTSRITTSRIITEPLCYCYTTLSNISSNITPSKSSSKSPSKSPSKYCNTAVINSSVSCSIVISSDNWLSDEWWLPTASATRPFSDESLKSPAIANVGDGCNQNF